MPIKHSSELANYLKSDIFDLTTYKKSGSIVRMMANFLGVEIFNKGIEEYLKKHKYENVEQVNFFIFYHSKLFGLIMQKNGLRTVVYVCFF